MRLVRGRRASKEHLQALAQGFVNRRVIAPATSTLANRPVSRYCPAPPLGGPANELQIGIAVDESACFSPLGKQTEMGQPDNRIARHGFYGFDLRFANQPTAQRNCLRSQCCRLSQVGMLCQDGQVTDEHGVWRECRQKPAGEERFGTVIGREHAPHPFAAKRFSAPGFVA